MGNHLREVIEQIDADQLMLSRAFTSEGVDNVTALEQVMRAQMERAMCFDMGHEDGTLGLSMIPGMFRIPYATCWFECELNPAASSSGARTVAILASEAEQGLELYFFKRDQQMRQPWVLLGMASEVAERSTRDGVAITGNFWPRQSGIDNLVGVLWAFLSALNCINVQRIKHDPDIKLQRARSRRKRAPLFSYWTLGIDLGRGAETRANAGGTHASPRLHLRRGHARQFKPNEWTWVQAHVVGNKQSGLVHKDYRNAR